MLMLGRLDVDTRDTLQFAFLKISLRGACVLVTAQLLGLWNCCPSAVLHSHLCVQRVESC